MNNKGYLYLIMTVIFFSTYEVVSRTVIGAIDPVQINFFRFFFGGLILLAPAIKDLRRRKTRLCFRDFAACLLLGFLLVGISMILLNYGINLTQANLAAVIFSSNPLFVALAAIFILGEPLSRTKTLGLAVGFVGVGLMLVGGHHIHGDFARGVFYLVLSALVFGIYTVYGKKLVLRVGSLTMNSLTFILGSLTVLPLLWYRHIAPFSLHASIWPQMAYLTVFVTGLAYYLYFRGLSMVDTSIGAMVFFIKPILAGILAAITLGEKISLNLVIGTFLVLVSIYLVQRSVSNVSEKECPLSS